VTMHRFTEGAQNVLQRAQLIMQADQHTQLDVEHIFLALLQQPNGLASHILGNAGGDVAHMVRRLESTLKDMPKYSRGRGTVTGYITLRANRVLQGAAQEADRLNDDFISTEHLLLSVTHERTGASASILQEAQIDHEKLNNVIRDIGGTQGTSPEISQMAETKTIINPPSLAKPVGFNHGILTTGGRLLFLAGQTALDAEGRIVSPRDVVGQYRQALSNIKAVIEAAGGAMQDVVQTTIFVKDRDDYVAHLKELGQVHKEFFGAYYPATALLEISRFFDEEALVEVQGMAVIE
jgi:enamine deaminase RidA (YjgF/YER057c/UK114 family)